MSLDREKLLAQAKVGLDALIDEATGYQDERPSDELAKRYRDYGGKDSDYSANELEGLLREMQPGELWCSKDSQITRVRVIAAKDETVTYERVGSPGQRWLVSTSDFTAHYQPDVRPPEAA